MDNLKENVFKIDHATSGVLINYANHTDIDFTIIENLMTEENLNSYKNEITLSMFQEMGFVGSSKFLIIVKPIVEGTDEFGNDIDVTLTVYVRETYSEAEKTYKEVCNYFTSKNQF